MKKVLSYWLRGAVALMAVAFALGIFVLAYFLLDQYFGERTAVVVISFIGASLLLGMVMMLMDSGPGGCRNDG